MRKGEYTRSLNALNNAGSAVTGRSKGIDYAKKVSYLEAIEKRAHRLAEDAGKNDNPTQQKRAENIGKNVEGHIKFFKTKKHPDLERRASVTTAILGIAGGIAFSSLGVTGNVVGNAAVTSTVGALLFILGIIGAVVYFKSKNN